MTARTSVITDWRTPDEALPDIAPGDEYERVIVPQMFVVLHRILVRDLRLVRVDIGAAQDVPFELESTDGPMRRYRLKDLEALKKFLLSTGAAVAPGDTITCPAALEVRILLRNDGEVPAKPRAALLVQQEGS